MQSSQNAQYHIAYGIYIKFYHQCNTCRTFNLSNLYFSLFDYSKGRNGHIPYRDSKLTRILQTSLSGNARTAIICTMSPARSHVEQSRNTLLFASCAKEVATNAQVNIVMSDKALVKHLQRELERLESQLKSPRSTVGEPYFSAMLREKDLKIEKVRYYHD